MPSVAIESRKQAARRPKAPVAEPRVGFGFEQVSEIDAEALEDGAHLVVQVQGNEVVRQGAPEKELGRQVVDALRVALVVLALRLSPPEDQSVPHQERERHVLVVER
jgi:hypothetical protein